jgi:hypothetical protein
VSGHFRTVFGELTRALAVLAFAFLSFAHQPLAVERYGASNAVTTAFYCGAGFTGDPDDPSGKDDKTCQACRIASAFDLPAPERFTEPVLHLLGAHRTRPLDLLVPATPERAGGGPRAPPIPLFA